MNIFLSYGHDSHAIIAERLLNDLVKKGHNVWFDKRKLTGSKKWEDEIEKGIINSDWLILLMTNHSVRRPDGVCLDEVSTARYMGKKILPIMLQNVLPPFCIARIQWLDMQTNCLSQDGKINEEKYNEKLNEILDIIDGTIKLCVEGKQANLLNALSPLDNDVYYESYGKDFFGREWLFERFETWANDINSSKVFMLLGQAGTGKTSFVAALSSRYPNIVGIHFCKYNDNERANPKKALMSLAYHMSTQIPEYADELLKLKDLDRLDEKSIQRLFEYIFIEPLHKIPSDRKPSILIIDALDEAQRDSRNELLDVIVKEFDKTPSWLKLLVTSRAELDIVRKMSLFNPIIIEKNTENDKDVANYIAFALKDISVKHKDELLSILANKAQGSFLYAKEVVRCIKSGEMSLNDINNYPDGLTGIYLSYFERLFGDNLDTYKRNIRPLMEVLTASCEPLRNETICSILDIDEYDMDDISEKISTLFPTYNGCIVPMHKSVFDWLIDGSRSGIFRASMKQGHLRLLNYFGQKQIYFNKYAIKYICTHALSASQFEKATKYLSDKQLQEARIKILSLDSAVREYLYEIQKLANESYAYACEVMESEYFLEFLSKNRIFLYNSGLFFDIKKCGFDEVISKIMSNADIKLKVSIAYYYYITENFAKASEIFINLLKDIETTNIEGISIAGIYNVLGLCYRKYVDFDKAKECFNKANALANNELYEKSIAIINLGKISYHELDWSTSFAQGIEAERVLEECFKESKEDDERNTLELFIAEYNRLIAESVLWRNDIALAKKYLMNSSKIYESNHTRDRYYVRFQYTKILSEILDGNLDYEEENYDLVFKNAQSKYDKSQILYYHAFAEFLRGNNSSALDSLDLAAKYTKEIGALLEYGETLMLKSLIDGSTLTTFNDTIDKWLTHIKTMCMETKSKR